MSHLRPIDLADLLRGKLAPEKAERARAHLDACAACQTAFARVRGANQAFDDLLSQPLPEVGMIRGEATVRWTRLPSVPAVRRPFFVMAGAALAAAGLLLVWNPKPRVTNGPLIVHLSAPPSREKPLEAVVTLLGGVVQLTHGGATARLDPSMTVKSGDRLSATSEARVAAQWAEGSGFLLLGDSELSVERLAAREVKLVLANGKVDVRRGPHGPDDALQVVAPAHIIRARGTWFTVAAAQYQTTVEVLEGVVEVTDRENGASTTLHAPTHAVFGRGANSARSSQTPIAAHEAAALRVASEMNLLPPALRDENAILTIASEPAGTLAVDGVELGPTPLQARQPLGRHYVEIARHGFEPLRRWVTLGAEPGQLRVALVRSEVESEPQSVPVEVESMIHARAAQIRGCYERRLKRDPTLAGTVSLRLRVGDAGQVRQASVDESTLADPMVGECLRKEALGWSFQKGRNATVVYPFVFRAQ
jgi:ferric-dicitrate binding protein FerR (iron transport regulator)